MNTATQAAAPPELTLVEPVPQQPLATVHQHPVTLTADQVLAQAIQAGATLEQMERFMALAERMRAQQLAEEKRRAEKASREDFARFKALNIVVPKTKSVNQTGRDGKPGPRYKQSEFHVVASLLQPALASCNFGYRFDVKFIRGGEAELPWCEVTCRLEHAGGHVETMTLGGPPDDSGSKNALQEMQSSATFLMRHALLAITGTAQEGNDNDGRGVRGIREDEGRTDNDAEASKLVDAGNAEADKGEKALDAWWGALTEPQRGKVMPFFGGMKAVARKKTQGAKS